MSDKTQTLSPSQGKTIDWLSYTPSPGVYDESFESSGTVRPHWVQFLKSIRHLDAMRLNHRWAEAQYLIHQNGVTYNVYGDPRGLERPWQLDPIPLLIPSQEAEFLQRGLTQRGLLLEALLRDLYGPQKVIGEGLLPPQLVFANPAFLRSCHGLPLPGNRFLHLYAANIGRDASGSFWVLGDRSQCPSGAGYALENRIVLSRMLPDLFKECQVQRLATFFQTLRESLSAIAPPRRGDSPRIVLLTPGPYNETYFEHAYLARYLGFTLVEGGDLTVRDNRVYLKVLGGLQPVDVIFRRLDDDYCDPLELRHDSFLGVPGLVQAVRAGTVSVANALGSGMVETPALLAFLPGLCRYLLNEELLLPSAPTWWCGQAKEREYVLSHLDELVIKPARPGLFLEPQFGYELSSEQRARLSEKIRSRPEDYIGQQPITLATTPVLSGNRIEPRHVVMRLYLAARENSFVVMPGGLTRVGSSPETMVVSMQAGGGSKDTWVLSAGPVSTFSLLKPDDHPVELSRGGSELPSRVADNFFWLGRYAERADGLARLLRCILIRLTETSALVELRELPALLRGVTRLSDCMPGFLGEGAEGRLANHERELRAVIHDVRRAGSLVSTLGRLTGIVTHLRDRISIDMWRVLNDLTKRRTPFINAESTLAGEGLFAEREGDWQSGEEEKGGMELITLSNELNLLDRIVLTLAAFGGLTMESVTRGEGWRFLDMGRKIERSLHTISILQSTLVTQANPEIPLLEAVLEITDSAMTYRRRYQGYLQPAAVLDLVLADETNPRALAFQLTALAADVDQLPRPPARVGYTEEQRVMLSALTSLRLANMTDLALVDGMGIRPRLGDLLSKLTTSLFSLSDSLTRTYLSHLQTARHLGKWMQIERTSA